MKIFIQENTFENVGLQNGKHFDLASMYYDYWWSIMQHGFHVLSMCRHAL